MSTRNRFGHHDDTDGIPEQRIFSHRLFRRVAVDTDKDAANDEADYRRAGGNRARVVKCSRGRWAVYAREG